MFSVSGFKRVMNSNWTTMLIVLAIIVLRGTFMSWYHIPSGSMIPTLRINDRVIVDMDAYSYRVPMTDVSFFRKGEPEQGDVVIFNERHSGVVFVKRVIGLAGDKIKINGHDLFINGKVVKSEHVGLEGGYSTYKQTLNGKEFLTRYSVSKDGLAQDSTDTKFRSGEWTVPGGEIFVMGDNRDESRDSRFESVGSVPVEFVRGKVSYILANIEPLNIAGIDIQLIPVSLSDWNRSVYEVEAQ